MRPLLALALTAALLTSASAPAVAAPLAAVAAPVLKWQYGGCQTPPHYCETGWYASPAVADLDGDGTAEVLWGGYTLYALNGESGGVQWSAANGQRIWPGIAVADLDADGDLEVVVGRGGDQVTAYTSAGAVAWSRNPFGNGEVRSLAVADLDSNGRLEVVVGRASGGATKQVHVFDAAGAPRPGWPARRDGEAGYGWGMYNENLALADLDGDSQLEIYGPTDTHYITALRPDGSQLPASPIYGANKVWSQVGVHVDHAVDLRGYANCGSEHRPNFADSAPATGDLDGDGSGELVVVGNVYNCGTNPYTSLYRAPFVFKSDRTRWAGSGYDWTAIPPPPANGAPRSEDYNRIQSAAANVVLADLDGDGTREILFPSYDGRLHAYWLDKGPRGNWPFVVPGTGIRFASEPAVADLDNDGRAEVIITSWPENGGNRVGQLHILDYQGNQLHALDLPAPGSGATWNGGLAAPTLANLDDDAELEVVVGTTHSGAVAYDLPGSAAARILWGTGRGGFQRTGAAPVVPPALRLSSARPTIVLPAGPSVRFAVEVAGVAEAVTLTHGELQGPAPLPVVTLEPGSLAGPGQATVTLTAAAGQSTLAPGSYSLVVTARNSLATRTLTLRAIVGGRSLYLPYARR